MSYQEIARWHADWVEEIVPIVVENRSGSSRTLSHHSVLASNPLPPDKGFERRSMAFRRIVSNRPDDVTV